MGLMILLTVVHPDVVPNLLEPVPVLDKRLPDSRVPHQPVSSRFLRDQCVQGGSRHMPLYPRVLRDISLARNRRIESGQEVVIPQNDAAG